MLAVLAGGWDAPAQRRGLGIFNLRFSFPSLSLSTLMPISGDLLRYAESQGIIALKEACD